MNAISVVFGCFFGLPFLGIRKQDTPGLVSPRICAHAAIQRIHRITHSWCSVTHYGTRANVRPPLFRYLASRPRCALQPFPQKLRVGSSTLFVKVAEGFFRNVAVLRIVICDSSEGCVGRARGNLVYYGMVWVCVPRCHPPHLGLVRGNRVCMIFRTSISMPVPSI